MTDMLELEKVSTLILKAICGKQQIREDLIHEMAHIAFSYTAVSDESLPASFERLELQLQQYWRLESGTVSGAEQTAFMKGCLLAFAGIIKQKNETKLFEKDIELLAGQYTRLFPIFNAMAEQKGITHKRLARVSLKTESRLSQILAKTALQPFFYTQKTGREKYYFLSGDGIRLLDAMKSLRKKEPISFEDDEKFCPVIYAAIENNIQNIPLPDVMYKAAVRLPEDFSNDAVSMDSVKKVRISLGDDAQYA